MASEPSRLTTVFISTSVGTIMSGINTSIVSTALPSIQQQLHVTTSSAQWLVSIYTLVLSVLLLPMGRAGDLVGHHRIYRSGLWIFGGASVACALVANLPLLLVMRVVQATGGAMIMASVPAILTLTFPPAQRGRILGLFAMNVYLGLSLGPLFGGFLAAVWGWHAIFWLNLPFFLTSYLLARRLPGLTGTDRSRSTPLDLRGGVLFFLAMATFLISLNQGFVHQWHWPWPIGLVLALGLFGWFTRAELRVPHPMLALPLLKRRVVALSSFATLMNYFSMFFFYLLVPIALTQGLGIPLSQVGLAMTATPATMVIVSQFSGRISDRVGTLLPQTVGLAVFGLGLALLAWVSIARIDAALMGIFVLVGVGLGLFSAPSQSAVMGATPAHLQGMASGLLGTVRYSGQSLGVTVAGALFTLFAHIDQGQGLAAATLSSFHRSLWIGAGLALLGAVAAACSQPRAGRANRHSAAI